MRHLPTIVILAGFVLGGCASGVDSTTPRKNVVLYADFEPALSKDLVVHSTRNPRLDPVLPDITSIAEALRMCGVRKFTLLGINDAHGEGVSFTSTPNDKNAVRCVANHLPFDILAGVTSDSPMPDDLRLRPIDGI